MQNITKNTPIVILGQGGLGANLTMLLLEQGYKNLTVVDADTVDEKFCKRFTYFTDSKLLNNGRSKVKVVKDIALKRGYKDNLKYHAYMITPEFNFEKFKDSFVIISVDILSTRQMIELNLKKNGIPFIHIGCNLNSVSLFKTSLDIMGDDPMPDAQTSYEVVPDTKTYLVACLEVLNYLNPTKINIYKEE